MCFAGGGMSSAVIQRATRLHSPIWAVNNCGALQCRLWHVAAGRVAGLDHLVLAVFSTTGQGHLKSPHSEPCGMQ
jgi:hypothetical protein